MKNKSDALLSKKIGELGGPLSETSWDKEAAWDSIQKKQGRFKKKKEILKISRELLAFVIFSACLYAVYVFWPHETKVFTSTTPKVKIRTPLQAIPPEEKKSIKIPNGPNTIESKLLHAKHVKMAQHKPDSLPENGSAIYPLEKQLNAKNLTAPGTTDTNIHAKSPVLPAVSGAANTLEEDYRFKNATVEDVILGNTEHSLTDREHRQKKKKKRR